MRSLFILSSVPRRGHGPPLPGYLGARPCAHCWGAGGRRASGPASGTGREGLQAGAVCPRDTPGRGVLRRVEAPRDPSGELLERRGGTGPVLRS